MYILDKANNEISPLTEAKFSESNLSERYHLQEWIAKKPYVLGEDLLIIQKEYDDFDGTKERLDLLALDKNGRLVIIENKIDDSGKNVTIQALKYASYCSTMTKDNIVEALSKYLGKSTEEAKDKILQFLGKTDFEEIKLNPEENSQRIFLVAGSFRPEVASCVLWLSKYGLEIKCFKVTLFHHHNDIFIDFDQVIPSKEVEDYIQKISVKSKQAEATSEIVKVRSELRQQFWKQFIDLNVKYNGLYAGSSASGTESWLTHSLGVPGIQVNVGIANKWCRAIIYICQGSREKNKQTFDFYYLHKEAIQNAMQGFTLNWNRNDDNDTSQIGVELQKSYLEETNWNEIMNFLLDKSKKLKEVFSKYNHLLQ